MQKAGFQRLQKIHSSLLYKDFLLYDQKYRSIKSIKHIVLPWLQKYYESPHFLFYHTYETHSPFPRHEPITDYFFLNYKGAVKDVVLNQTIKEDKSPGIGMIEKFSQNDEKYLVALYDSGIRFADGKLTELFSFYIHNKIFNNTIIILLSDHGEHLAEHGLYGHSNSLFNQLLKVPLIFSFPEKVPRNIVNASIVNMTDIPATIASLAGFDLSFSSYARNLADTIIENRTNKSSIGFSELRLGKENNIRNSFALTDEEYKYILSVNEDEQKLFHLPSQEMDEDNLAEKRENKVQYYNSMLNDLVPSNLMLSIDNNQTLPSSTGPDNVTIKILHELGYIEQ